MNIYEFMRECEEDGLSPEEAQREWELYLEEKHNLQMERYMNDPLVHEGWAQQDIIDMYRRER